jgi:hypothetical protein
VEILLRLPDLVAMRDDPSRDDVIRERLTERFGALTRQQAAALFADDDTCVEVLREVGYRNDRVDALIASHIAAPRPRA